MSTVNALTTNTNTYYSAAGLQPSTLGGQLPAATTDVAPTARLPPATAVSAAGPRNATVAQSTAGNTSLSAAVTQAAQDTDATVSVARDQHSALNLTVNQSNGDVQQFAYQSGSLLSTSA